MRPYDSNVQQHTLNDHFQDPTNNILLLKTPIKIRLEQHEHLTTAQQNLYLTPLVPPAKLTFASPRPDRACSFEVVDTPYANRYAISSFIEQDTHDSKPLYSISTKDLFNNEQIDEASSSQASRLDEESWRQNDSDNYSKNQDSNKFKELRNENLTQQNLNELKRLRHDVSEDSFKEKSTQKKGTCNCKKTQCLKLYCDCFRDGITCGDACQCVGCHNTSEFEVERAQVKVSLKKRNPGAFDKKIQGEQHSKGCNCKRTGCLKKYCQCFQAGLGCGEHCKCEQCKNCSGMNDRYTYNVRKQRRLRQI